MNTEITNAVLKEEIFEIEPAEKPEVLKRLYVGFSNKSKLESLRFFVI